MNDRDGSLAAGGGSLDRNGAGKQNRTAIWALQMLHRGIYADQLAPFLMRFPIGSQLLVLQSEDFFRNEAATMEQLTSFLGVAPLDWNSIVKVKFNFEKGASVRASGADEARCASIRESRALIC